MVLQVNKANDKPDVFAVPNLWLPARRSVTSARKKRYECTLDSCGRQYQNTFDLYRHQRQKHNVPPEFYQQGKKQTFGIREIDPSWWMSRTFGSVGKFCKSLKTMAGRVDKLMTNTNATWLFWNLVKLLKNKDSKLESSDVGGKSISACLIGRRTWVSSHETGRTVSKRPLETFQQQWGS